MALSISVAMVVVLLVIAIRYSTSGSIDINFGTAALLALVVWGFAIFPLYTIISSSIRRGSYLLVENGQLSFVSWKRLVWAVSIASIEQIDVTQHHKRFRGHLVAMIGSGVGRGQPHSRFIGFLVLAGGKEYEVYHELPDYAGFLRDLLNVNPAIQVTDLTNSLERQYTRGDLSQYAANKYSGSPNLAKRFVVWFTSQNVLVAALIVIAGLALVFFLQLGIIALLTSN